MMSKYFFDLRQNIVLCGLAHQTTDPNSERDLGNYETIISMQLLKCMCDNMLIMSKYRNSDVT